MFNCRLFSILPNALPERLTAGEERVQVLGARLVADDPASHALHSGPWNVKSTVTVFQCTSGTSGMPQLLAYLPCIPREKLSKIVAMSKVQVKADSLNTLGKGNKY